MSYQTWKHPVRWFAGSLMLLWVAVVSLSASAEQVLDDSDLESLVAPIALYPDDLLAVVLPAATYPLQVVQAARFLEDSESDRTLQPDPDWDDSIVALLNYPEVLELMNEDLDWTWALGEAVIEQESEVLAAVSDFREQANTAGNLRSDDKQIVEVVDERIEIRPADPEVIYVPYYEPERVIVYQPSRVVYYYPRRYPVYYYPYPAGYAFYDNRFWGVTSAFSIGWTTRHLHLHYREWDSHPYYGYHYLDRYSYRRPSVVVYNQYVYPRHSGRHHEGNYWQRGNHHAGARPQHRTDRSRAGKYREHDRNETRKREQYREQPAWQPSGNQHHALSDRSRPNRDQRDLRQPEQPRVREQPRTHDQIGAPERSRSEWQDGPSQRNISRNKADRADRVAANNGRPAESGPRTDRGQRQDRVAATPPRAAAPEQSPRTERQRQSKSDRTATRSETREARSDPRESRGKSRNQEKSIASRGENDELRGRFLR